MSQSVLAQVIQVTSVEVKTTASGSELIIQTANGSKPQVLTSSSQNTLIVDIPNTQLNLSNRNTYQIINPSAGIGEVTATNLTPNSIQIRITGTNGLPRIQLAPSDSPSETLRERPGLVFSLQPKEQEIEITVTATRTEEALINVPRSVTVITREQIQEQAAANRNVIDILANSVPGFGSPTNRVNTLGQTLRGREISVLIDGVPQNSNFNPLFTELTSIDPSAIERIEVIRGTNAIYGGKATGGTINIITRQSSEDRLSSEIEVGGNISLTNLEDSFGGFLKYGISGKEGKFDYTASLSLDKTGSFFDAEGDRISQYTGPEDSLSLNGLVKFGVDLDNNQRLQFTLNHFDQTRDTKFIPDPEIDNIPGIQKARAIRLPEGTRVIGVDNFNFTKNTLASLTYTNEDLFGSEVQAQVYYRDNSFGGGFPQDGRDFFGFIFSSPGESQQFGTRLQINTPLSKADTISLLWGVDYNRETSSQKFNLFDPVEFDNSGGLIYRKFGERTFTPEYKFNDLGLFAQLQWDISEQFQLSGGLRHVRLGLDVEDYITFDDRQVTGGKKNFSDTVFNAALVYKPSEEVSLFANFSQGFSVPDIGQVLRRPPDGFVNVTDSFSLTEPQKVDNYEIGIKGQWSNFQASLSAFYNYSDLGADFAVVDNLLETIRAPQKVYGVEAAVDVQPSPKWKLGGTLTWLEGENDPENTGNFVALNSITIPPLKLTGYIENQTTPGWRNRLQFLLSGNRERAFNDEVDSAPIDSFFTVDYLSTIKVGRGELQIGVQNLFNSQYFPVYSQYFAPFFDSSNYAGRGRSLSVGYKLTW
ncbi:TonB-dependent siderophore receptor [Merismopedia glauca CCAP 1448/3]|uniref:TonB-dependent siderophore receptor n=2 Tax=Merismopedia TaxID=53402 RepID=A0A2T1BZF6_9CYAN|nr:TonB-dependent siderophore receptor [Merismopedia glauca CCAP 1448/3]